MSNLPHPARPTASGARMLPFASLVTGVVAGAALRPGVSLGGFDAREVLGAGLALMLAAVAGRLAWTRSRRWRRRLTDGLWRARRLGAWHLRCAARRHLTGARGALWLWVVVTGAAVGLGFYTIGGVAWDVARQLATAVLSPWVPIALAAAGGGILLGRRGRSLGQGTWGAYRLAARALRVVAVLALVAFLLSTFGDNVRAMFQSDVSPCPSGARACL